jgi:hypothetical protein
MKSKFIIIAPLIFLLFTSLFYSDIDRDSTDSIEKNLQIEAEFQLAKGTAPYFFFDLRQHRIQLKIGGLSFREWQIEVMDFWGDPIPIKPIRLIAKTTLVPISRKIIKPSKDQAADTTASDTLDVSDMPGWYSLQLEDGIEVHIKPRTRGIVPALGELGNTLERFFSYPVQILWAAINKKNFSAISLTFSDEEATKNLYWTCLGGMSLIFLPPRNLVQPPEGGIYIKTR